jgi:hypothetical protein
MMDDKKRMDNPKLAVLIAMKAKKKAMEKDSGGEDSMYEDMASDVLDAVKSGDAAALAESLKDFIDACKGGGGSRMSEESDEEEEKPY